MIETRDPNRYDPGYSPDIRPITITVPNADTFQFLLLGELRVVRHATADRTELDSFGRHLAQIDAAVEGHCYLTATFLANPFALPESFPATIEVHPGYPDATVERDGRAWTVADLHQHTVVHFFAPPA